MEQDAPAVISIEGKPGKPVIIEKSKGSGIQITFKDLVYTVKVKEKNKATGKMELVDREILKGITGIANVGEVCAIMGASGAGKTSLLNILSCQIKGTSQVKIGGKILANGKEYNSKQFNKFAGYVMQNDILLETLTPRECLQFAANLRLNATKEEKINRVNKLLSDLKLERAADTLVGGSMLKGISGGERKRASIGVELITNPALLFLDEPTSGLDSFTAFVIINLLKTQAAAGKTIIFTIHQPSSDIFEMFDRYMVLSKGKFIYQGAGKDTVDYFSSIGFKCPDYSNPADYIMEIAHADHEKDKFNQLFESYDKVLAPKILTEFKDFSNMEISVQQKEGRFCYEFSEITTRAFKTFRRNPVLLQARVGQTLFMSFLCCSLYFQLGTDQKNPRNISNRLGALYFMIIGQFMTSLMSVLLTFPAERAVFLKEQGANMYSVPAYFFGRQLVELPFVTIFPFIFSLICYWIIGFNNDNPGKFFIFALFMILQSLSGNAMGIMTGCLFNDARVASGIAPLAVMPLMIFGGFYINDSQMPVWLAWIKYISPFYYAMQALVRNEFFDSSFGTAPIENLGFNLSIGICVIIHIALQLSQRFWALVNLRLLVKKLQ